MRNIAQGPRASSEASAKRAVTKPKLPDNIVARVMKAISERPQPLGDLVACSLVSRQWREAANEFFYINVHCHCDRTRDLLHQLHGRLVGHVKSFVATRRMIPADSIEVCYRPVGELEIGVLQSAAALKTLDLLNIGINFSLQMLLRVTKNLTQLTHLTLPNHCVFYRSNCSSSPFPRIEWPPGLRDLRMTGRVDEDILDGTFPLPSTLEHLSIRGAGGITNDQITRFLDILARLPTRLRSLQIINLPDMTELALDDLLDTLPGLEALTVNLQLHASQRRVHVPTVSLASQRAP